MWQWTPPCSPDSSKGWLGTPLGPFSPCVLTSNKVPVTRRQAHPELPGVLTSWHREGALGQKRLASSPPVFLWKGTQNNSLC